MGTQTIKFKAGNYIILEEEGRANFAQVKSICDDRYELRYAKFKHFGCTFVGFAERTELKTIKYIDRKFEKTTRKAIMARIRL